MIAQGVGHLRGDRCFFFDNACRQYPRYAALPLSPFLDPKHPVIGEHPLHRSSRALFPAHGLGQMAMNLAGDPLHRGAFLPQVVESSVPQPNHSMEQNQSSRTSTHARRHGLLLGLAAGDKNGGPIQMALCLAESLAEHRRFDLESIWQAYFQWWAREGFDTGPTAESVFRHVADGMPWKDAAGVVNAERGGQTVGCNPAHRASPLAMATFLMPGELSELAMREAALTHAHSLAGEVSAAVIELCRGLIDGLPWKAAIKSASASRTPEVAAALMLAEGHPLDDSGYSPEVLRAAVFFVDSSHDFSSALEASLKFAGPANYSPVLVGAIAGSRYGAESVCATHWPAQQIVERIRRLTDRLAGV